jgi:NDP-sugar pyrophosphorylase family protein
VIICEWTIIGPRAIVRERAIIHASATIDDVTVGPDVIVPRGAYVRRDLLATPRSIDCGDHVAWLSGPNEISIGCHTHSVEYWRANLAEIAYEHDIDAPAEIERYRQAIETLAKKEDA